MLSAVEAQASGDLADLAGVNAAEKRPVAGSRIFSGKRAHVYEAIYGIIASVFFHAISYTIGNIIFCIFKINNYNCKGIQSSACRS